MVQQLRPAELAAKLAAGEPVYLLDVRQPEEHAFAALPNSTLIPLGELANRTAEVEPPPGALVVVYCHHGIRSVTGAALLERAGIGPTASLSGGIDAWSALIDPKVPRY
jgi:adenylyltransferase/sulfurtransferase